MSDSGPYFVKRVETPNGPAWRLCGPGLDRTRAYPWDEFRDKLDDVARLMNFAWRQGAGKDGKPDERV